ISILDPRRFTPTLHANLVSEILALRRDQEEKIRTIETLENELHNTRGEHEKLESSLSVTSKESRSLKRQLALLEGGTSSALSELARERDEAVDSNAETKRRLEAAQKKIRAQEEDADRVHQLWAGDKDNWADEKRKYERRIHAAEGRLKAVLDEVAAYQANHQAAHINSHAQAESEPDEPSRDHAHGHGSDTASVRSMSLTNSIRFSTLNGVNGHGGLKLGGISLADELDLDEDEDPTDHEGRESVLSLRHNRTQSRESMVFRMHQRNQSTDSVKRPASGGRGRWGTNQTTLDKLEGGILEDDETTAPAKANYVDAGVQHSPLFPQSPVLESPQRSEPLSSNGSPVSGNIEKPEHQAPREWEIEANQRRKRVHASPTLVIEPATVSTESQTVEDPPSPPRTPASPTRLPPPPPMVVQVMEMVSVSTQTDAEPLSPRRHPPPPPIPIPSIQLHPPTSAPATPREPLLPQQFKDAGCQVSMQAPVPIRSIAVQTEEIRVDKRLNLLPPHLQPSAISSTPPSPEPLDETKRFSPIPGNLPERNPRRIKSRRSLEQVLPSSPPSFSAEETRDAYPGNNDDGPLAKDKGTIRRPHRISSLFAGFDNVSSDDADDFADADMSDSDYRTALSAPKPHAGRPSKRISSTPTSVPENQELAEVSKPLPRTTSLLPIEDQDLNEEPGSAEIYSVQPRIPPKSAVRQLDKPLSLVTTKPNAMRRAALIQSGVAAHQSRSRSPSLPEPVKEPPFPIPTRASSRKPPISASAPSDGTRSPTWGRGSNRGPYRTNSIRKVRSAAALPRGGRNYRRHGSRSPPMSASTDAPESPQLPPMPSNEITTPRYMRDSVSSRYKTHKKEPSANTSNTANTANTTNTRSGSVGSSNQTTTVVDAIAQTMVGEWMFKYVRRRKSFGVSEANGADGDNGNGARHKRWVWLAPYERAVMWSSKQPTSGSALLGKSGRKLTIQSVLDVKDDNPAPKGVPPLFNRSILILTPARALKFTAVSPERHYIWLTALSFLAHSSQAVPEVVAAPLPIPKTTVPDFEIPRQTNRLRRNGIRDSIRVAKGKTASARSGPTSVHSSQQGENSIRETESFYSAHIEPAADPPVVPRFPDRDRDRGERGHQPPPLTHTRKRSNTGGRVPPPLSFRGFSGPAGPMSSGHAPTSSTAGLSVGTTGSSDIYQSQGSSSVTGYNRMSVSGQSSIRTSEASSRPGAVVNNFFDAVGTMRMEAFISPMALSRFNDYPDELDEMDHVGMHRRRRSRDRRSRNGDSTRSSRPSDDYYGGSKTAGEEEYGHFDGYHNDPFRGF
ncbi:hypothetical protein OIDMADRAFT_138579, partial [Oidiodendron maius Zn]